MWKNCYRISKEYSESRWSSVDGILRATWLALEASNESEEAFCISATSQWRVRHHRAPIKCRVCASLLSCSRMRYAGALSAGIITNCRSSFDCPAASILRLRNKCIISKNNHWNHILLKRKTKWFVWRNKILIVSEWERREKKETDASHNLLLI